MIPMPSRRSRLAPYRLFAVVVVVAAFAGCGGQPEVDAQASGAPAASHSLAQAKAGWLTIDVLGVTRAGGGLLVRFRFANGAAQPFDFADRFAADPAERNSVADIALLDPSGRRKYFVLRDRMNQPVCSTGLSPLRPGEARMLFARFPAPPAGTSRITIQIPHGPDIADVPIGP